ncbi:MAG: hypothetical protein K6U87_13995 [Firmicutes bacterium]|nr:hypothetical protein [Bacillota bacterium]
MDFHQTQERPRIASDEDRQDLLQVLTMRFGTLPPEVAEAVRRVTDFEAVDHLILVAANAPSLDEVLEALATPGGLPLAPHHPAPKLGGSSHG